MDGTVIDTTRGFVPQQLALESSFNADFYGAIFGTAAAIAIMVATFIFAPLFIGIPLLVIGIISILGAAAIVVIKKIILLTSHRFYDVKRVEGQGNYWNVQSNTELEMEDGTLLRGIFIINRNIEAPIEERKLVIEFPGNGQIVHMHGTAARCNNGGTFAGHDLLSYSYRGSNESSGRVGSHKQNGLDGYRILQEAINKGYKIKNISLYGLSFGGSVATQVKKLWLENKQGNPALLAVHTLHSFDDFVSGHITDTVGKAIIKAISKFIFWVSGYSYHFTADDWNALGTRNFCIGGGVSDRIINTDMSLASNLLRADPDRTDTIIHPAGHNNFTHGTYENRSLIRQALQLS